MSVVVATEPAGNNGRYFSLNRNREPIMNKLFSAIRSVFNSDAELGSVANRRAAGLAELFANNSADDVKAALDAKTLADNFEAMPAVMSRKWEEAKIAAISPDLSPENRAAELAYISETAAALRAAYTIAADCRACFASFQTSPEVWKEFCARGDNWNDRIGWLRSALKNNRASARQQAAEQVIRVAAELSGEPIDGTSAAEKVAELRAAEKEIKDRAKREPKVVAAGIIKSMEKIGANQRAVLQELVTAIYGIDYAVLPTAEFDAFMAAQKAAA